MTVLTLACCFSGRAEARRPLVTVKVVATADLDSRSDQWTFYRANNLVPMDRGKMLYAGQGAVPHDNHFYLLSSRRRRWVHVTAPVADFLKAHPNEFPGAFDKDGRSVRYRCLGLLYYDRGNHESGILVRDMAAGSRYRLYHFHWDLGSNRITRADSIAKDWQRLSHVYVLPVGYDHRKATAFVQVVRLPRSGSAHWVEILALGRRQARRVAFFETSPRPPSRVFGDRDGKLALVVEYSELPDEGRPKGYLVDLNRGKVRTMQLPYVTYGAAFDPNGSFLLVYGSKDGMIRRFDLRTWKFTGRRRVGGLGHAMGFVTDKVVVLVRHHFLHFLDPVTLRELQRVRTSRFARGYWHVSGSVVGPGTIWLKNRSRVYVLSVSRQGPIPSGR